MYCIEIPFKCSNNIKIVKVGLAVNPAVRLGQIRGALDKLTDKQEYRFMPNFKFKRSRLDVLVEEAKKNEHVLFIAQFNTDEVDTQQPSQDQDTPQPSQDQDTPQPSQDQDTPQLSQDQDTPQLSQDQDTQQLSQDQDTPQPSQDQDTPQPSQDQDTPQPSKNLITPNESNTTSAKRTPRKQGIEIEKQVRRVVGRPFDSGLQCELMSKLEGNALKAFKEHSGYTEWVMTSVAAKEKLRAAFRKGELDGNVNTIKDLVKTPSTTTYPPRMWNPKEELLEQLKKIMPPFETYATVSMKLSQGDFSYEITLPTKPELTHNLN